MNSNDANIFFDECSKVFYFLTTIYGFKKPTLDINQSIHFITVTFMGKNLAFECILDERENWVEFKVVRVFNGIKAREYAVDQSGKRIRDSLFMMLKRRGVHDFELKSKNIASKNIIEMFRAKLTTYADLLNKYGKDILGDSPNALDI